MKQRLICKGLAVAVIILFVGVGVQPAIAKIETENIDPEYYDVFIEFCGWFDFPNNSNFLSFN